MGTYTKNAIIVEFNGLPGCGKSTIVNSVSEGLSKQGYKTFTKFNCSFFSKSGIIFLLSVWCYILIVQVKHFCCQFSKDKNRSRFVDILIRHCLAYSTFLKRGQGIYLVDQGIIQDFLSIAHIEEIKAAFELSKIESILKYQGVSIIRVDVFCPIDVVIERINSRDKQTSRLSRKTGVKLSSYLNIQKKNLECLRRNLFLESTISLNSEEKIEDNAAKLIAYLLKKN